MFESLTENINAAIGTLRGCGKLSESNMRDGLNQVQRALLEADVSFSVAKDFIARAMENNRMNPRLKYEFAVILKSEGRLIGAVDIRMEEPDSREAKIGFSINPDFQNQGHATEAAIALIDFGFNSLGLETIKASCDSENRASRKVMQKAQMTQTAFIENDRTLRGEVRSSYEFEIRKP